MNVKKAHLMEASAAFVAMTVASVLGLMSLMPAYASDICDQEGMCVNPIDHGDGGSEPGPRSGGYSEDTRDNNDARFID